MKRLFFPAERPLDGRCPACGTTLVFVTVVELIDTALSARPDNLRDVPRWMCRRCWLQDATGAGVVASATADTPASDDAVA